MEELIGTLYSSSFERMETDYTSMSRDFGEIKSTISSLLSPSTKQQYTLHSTTVTVDEHPHIDLSHLFMKEAEVSHPWLSIGIDNWIQAGKWWFLKGSYLSSFTTIILMLCRLKRTSTQVIRVSMFKPTQIC